MSYVFYMDKVLLPVAPSRLQLRVNNQNKSINLINQGEVNILKTAGLTSIDFDCLIPQVRYPFAVFKSGFQKASYFLGKFEELKNNKKPFQFIVTRTLPDGKMLFDTNMKVSLEEYQIKEDKRDGFDLIISVKLKQFREFGTKTCDITLVENKSKAQQTVKPARTADPKKIGIGSDVIVNGRLHRDSYGEGAGQTRTNYRGKINFINMKGSHPYHVTTPEGLWQGWVTASSVQGV